MFMILGIQMMMVKELFALARVAQQERKLPGFRLQQWYIFMVAAFWLYLRFIKNNLMVEISSSAQLARLFGWLLKRHTILSFTLYIAGMMSFVLTLEKGMYTYQFTQFAWTHMILLVVFLPSSCFVSNLFEGMIWFLLPAALVIVNDIAAYLAGFFFGRTPLIKLSPKKTWEGFIGGFLGTVIASWYLALFMSKYRWLTCPRTDLSIWQPMECVEAPDTFKPHLYTASTILDWLAPEKSKSIAPYLPQWVLDDDRFSFVAMPMQLHAVMLAMFASSIAPFGGFFASGFKRGFKIKDFGQSIPGHGGVTDRFDCQVVMAAFSYVYYYTYVSRSTISLGAALSLAAKLTIQQRLELLDHLTNVLVGEEALPVELGEEIGRHVHNELGAH
jgi:phosphatidate cytidylyltransferase